MSSGPVRGTEESKGSDPMSFFPHSTFNFCFIFFFLSFLGSFSPTEFEILYNAFLSQNYFWCHGVKLSRW